MVIPIEELIAVGLRVDGRYSMRIEVITVVGAIVVLKKRVGVTITVDWTPTMIENVRIQATLRPIVMIV